MAMGSTGTAHNKARSVGPGLCLLSRVAREDIGALLGVVVGRSCRRWRLGPGVEYDGPLDPGHLGLGRERCIGRRGPPPGNDTPGPSDRVEMLEQGPDRQRAPEICCGGVSSMGGASESRCSQIGPTQGIQQGVQHSRHRSSPGAMGLHEGGFIVAVEAAPGRSFGSAEEVVLKPNFLGRKQVPPPASTTNQKA